MFIYVFSVSATAYMLIAAAILYYFTILYFVCVCVVFCLRFKPNPVKIKTFVFEMYAFGISYRLKCSFIPHISIFFNGFILSMIVVGLLLIAFFLFLSSSIYSIFFVVISFCVLFHPSTFYALETLSNSKHFIICVKKLKRKN